MSHSIRIAICALSAWLLIGAINAMAQTTFDEGFSGQFFLTYEHDLETAGDPVREFSIKRGYITFRRSITEQASIRFTQDISIDEEGDGAGDIELRLKYALVNLRLRDRGILTSPQVELGVVRRPWIDFEQKINDYRSQKEMFLDQNGILSSADYGVTFQSNLGEPASETSGVASGGGSWAAEGIRSPGGRLGSLSVGLYNGGGYSALERNTNKLLEGRLTLRPFPDRLPGLQASWLMAAGKGNTPESPDFRSFAGALSFESKRAIVFAQRMGGVGDGAGAFIDPLSRHAYRFSGWSGFTELVPVASLDRLRLTLRYDALRNESMDRTEINQAMAGIGYLFANRSKVILDVSRREAWQGGRIETVDRMEIVFEVRF